MRASRAVYFLLCLLFIFTFPLRSAWAETDVTLSVQVNIGRPYYDYTRLQTYTDISLTNVSNQKFLSPVKAVIGNITAPGVTVASADGYTSDGKPYLDFSSLLGDNALAPAEKSLSKTLRFNNPTRLRFNFSVLVYAGIELANNPPVLAATGDYSLDEGATLDVLISATDPDGDTLSFTATGLPAGASLDPFTGVFLYSPGYDVSNRAGDSFFDVFFEVNDGRGGTAGETVRVTVRDMNRPPELDPIGPQSISEGATLNFIVGGSDPDGDPLTYDVSGLPVGAVFYTVSRSIIWTPDYTQSGSYWATVSVSDGIASMGQDVRIDVADLNRTPEIITTEIPSGRVDQAYNFQLSAQDPDGDNLTYTLSEGPDGMVIDAATGLISWRPLLSHIGNHAVGVNVDDGHGGAASRQYNLAVPDNISPAIVLNAPKEAIPGAVFAATAIVSDNDRIASVTIDVNGQDPLEIITPPYQREISLPSVLTVGSSVILRAIASDASGNTAETIVPVAIVGAPDITPPVVTLNAPALITAGGTVQLTASVSDNSGVSSVSFYADGELIGTAPASAPVIEYQVPADAVIGATPVFTVKVEDFSGNVVTDESTPTVTDVPDSAPPEVVLTAPASAEGGALLTVNAQVSDAAGVALVEVYVDHTLVATYPVPPDGSMQIPLPPGLEPGTEALLEVIVTDFSGNQTTQSQMVSIEAVTPPARGVLTGEVYNDSTGLPVEGARVTFHGTDGSVANSVTDARGRYSLVAVEGSGRVTIILDGFTRVERTGVDVQGNRGREMFDARLTPVTSPAQPVSSVLGSRLTAPFSVVTAGIAQLSGGLTAAAAAPGQITVDIPSGALNNDNMFALHQISPQGLEGLLPLGWSPVGAVDLAPHGLSFNSSATITLPNPLGLGQTAGIVLAIWDETAGNWRAEADASAAANGEVISALISRTGQYAFLLADTLPQSPPVPSLGSPLQGVMPHTVPQDVATAVSPQPKIIFYKPGIHSDVSVNVGSSSTAISSGTTVLSKITEDYNFYSGAGITTEPYIEDIVLYNYNLNGAPGIAGYPVTPSYTFEPLTLEKGIITVEVMAPPDVPVDVNLIGPDGGTITSATGESITVPPGAVSDFIPVEIVPLTLSGSGITLPSGFNLAGAIYLSLGGNSLSLPASLSVPLPNTLTGSGQFLLVKPSEVQGATRLVLVGAGRTENGKVVSTIDLSGDGSVRFEGVLSGGRYLLIQTDTGIGFAGGKVYGATGAAFDGALVSNDTLSIVSLSMSQGDYVSATATGAFTLTALDGQR